jgi:hypothetical protein
MHGLLLPYGFDGLSWIMRPKLIDQASGYCTDPLCFGMDAKGFRKHERRVNKASFLGLKVYQLSEKSEHSEQRDALRVLQIVHISRHHAA